MNDPGLQAKHIIRFMDASLWKAMDESENVRLHFHVANHDTKCVLQGFFTIYGNLFLRLAAEENNFLDKPMVYPSFGKSAWSWSNSKGGNTDESESESVRDFYNAWMSFSTAKDFAWRDLWNPSEAPDRRVRRYACTCLKLRNPCLTTSGKG